jgi:hypothetical protein
LIAHENAGPLQRYYRHYGRGFDVTGIWFGLSLLKGAAAHKTAQNPDEDWRC